MLRIGLTGGIAAGKSAVAAELGRLGAVVVDADLLARTVVEPGTPGLDEIVGAFGAGVLTADGSLDRPALGRLVFGDSASREALNRIIHPRVRAEAARLIAAAPADAVVVEDIPLLVETHQAARFHLVLVVDARDELRIARMVERRGMDRRDAEQRIAAQAPRAERRAAADALLVNEGPLEDLLATTEVLWNVRILPFAANLAHRRPADAWRPAVPGPAPAGGLGAPAVLDPASADEGSSAGADAWCLAGTHGLDRRVRAKLAAALPTGVGIETAANRAGGPAVGAPGGPGGASEPGSDPVTATVAEVLVRLGPGEDVEAVSGAVADAGFPRADRPRRADAGPLASGRGPAVVHRSADPALDVTVTVLPAGGEPRGGG